MRIDVKKSSLNKCPFPIQLWIGPYVFVIFIIVQLFFIIYVKVKVPETKNRTIEDITAQFRN